jgi:PAS domain S-box-containing protein
MFDYQLRQREYLLKIARAMTSELDLAAVLRLVIQYAVELVDGLAGLVALRRSDDTFAIAANYGLDPQWLPHFAPLLTDVPLEPTRWAIPRLQRKLSTVAAAMGLGLGQVVAVPLVLQEQIIGIIYVFRSEGAALFSPIDREVVASFADHAAVAVGNARLFQQVTLEKQRLDTLIQHSTEGVLILDAQGRVQMLNRPMEEMSGWSQDAAIGRPGQELLAITGPQGQALPLPPIPQIRSALPGERRSEGYLSRRDGRRGPFVSATYAPLYDDEGRLASVVVSVTDVTRFKESEDLKTTFISAISHELKTPIALIMGYADTLNRPDVHWDEETVRQSLAVIQDEAVRLNRLVNNLLDAARLQAGALRLQLADVRLDELASRLVEEFRRVTDRHAFATEFPQDFPLVQADAERMRQVFSNLLSNAVKYSPQGGTIRVGGWVDRERVGLYVADEGIGIPLDLQSRIFEPFVRGDSRLGRRTAGTGLGLYLSKAIVEAHGGRIWVESMPGRGATFYVTLPKQQTAETTKDE